MKLFRIAVLSLAALGILSAPATGQDRIYFTEYKYEDPSLRAMDLDGANVSDLFDPGNTIPPSDWLTVGLALDEAAGKIYWLHGSTPGLVRRANLDGGAQELLVSGLRNPRGLALDPAGGKMYWAASPPTGNAGGMIQRASPRWEMNGISCEVPQRSTKKPAESASSATAPSLWTCPQDNG